MAMSSQDHPSLVSMEPLPKLSVLLRWEFLFSLLTNSKRGVPHLSWAFALAASANVSTILPHWYGDEQMSLLLL